MRKVPPELLRFAAVGGSAVALDFLVYFALVHAHVPASAAKAVSFIAGAVLAFALNRSYVFRVADRAASAQALPFITLYVVTLALNNAVNAGMLLAGATRPLAWFFATGASTIANFLGMKLVVFRQ